MDLTNGRAYLVSAARTPIGRLGGAISTVPAPVLGGVAIRAAIDRAGLPVDVTVDEVLMGQVIQAGTGQAPARQAAMAAGLAATTTATTVNRVCGSGLKAIMLAAAQVRAGDGDLFVAGGQESMSLAPYLLSKARFGYRFGDGVLEDSVMKDALTCAFGSCAMGTHAERVAQWAGLTREELDEYALESHRRALAAIDAGRFEDEMAPVTVRDPKGRETVVSVDEGPRRDTTLEALAKLRPAFEAPAPSAPATGFSSARTIEGGGGPGGPSPALMVTAGNSPGITDGAAATVVASERAVERYGLRPLARILGYAQAELEPDWLFLAPIAGVRKLLDRIEMPIEAFDLIEINEAFASQTLADGRELGFDWSRVNVNGGAIALGHPVGASGARIVATLLHELRRRRGRFGLATLCLGGGGSVAMAFERLAD